MPSTPLRLEVAQYQDVDHWRWVLKDGHGAFLDDHTIALDRTAPEYAALLDLPAYLYHRAAPDNREAEERLLVQRVGAWIGERLLGPAIGAKLIERAAPSVVVRVTVPAQRDRLLTLPLELAHFAGKPLSLHGVGFVFEPDGAKPPTTGELGERLRMLALFSMPPVGSPLNLRRERQMLRHLVRDLTGARGLAVELRVLQYGVTRERLATVLKEAEGWDVIHFSGHGMPGSLVLEKPDGSPDVVSSAELAALLRQAGSQLKLVMLSACHSAAASIEQTLGWLGITDAAVRRDAAATPSTDPAAAPTVARAVIDTFGCAVLAMRYAVEDEFATALGKSLYEALFTFHQPLPRAMLTALQDTVAGPAAPGAISASAPALFGARAADLVLVPPKGALVPLRPPPVGLALLRQREPAHFVGRTRAMTDASAALAREADSPGLLFHGMPGAGKTSCAVELALHHAEIDRFQHFVWFVAPEQGRDITLALRDFALAMERQLPGFEMVHVVDQVEAFKAWLPRFTAMLDQNAVLLVLDNLESLLTAEGQWRDDCWALLMQALLVPGGLSRVVLTSRTRLAELPAATAVIPVDALPRDEALLLVRALPNLRRLIDGRVPGVTRDQGRNLVRCVLRLVQGHPKLIELAEAQAVDSAKLAAQLDRAAAAQKQGEAELDAFLHEDRTCFGDPDFLASLRAWTNSIGSALPEASRLFFHFLCAMEEDDREDSIIAANWPDLWRRLERPAPSPDVESVLAPLLQAALVERQAIGDEEKGFRLMIHPGIAEAGREAAGVEFQQVVDEELADTWQSALLQGLEAHGNAQWAGPLIVRAGPAAFPYLTRRGKWDAAAMMLEQGWTFGDQSPAMLATVLRHARHIADATAGTESETRTRALLARFLAVAGRGDEAETILRATMAKAEAGADFPTASTAAGNLADLLREAGKPDEALLVLDLMEDLTRRAGQGPWSHLAGEGRRLQVLLGLGKAKEVLHRVMQLHDEMRCLPDPPGPEDWAVQVWNVRETTLGVGCAAAAEVMAWQQALDLNAEIIRSQQVRGASALDQARTRFNVYRPLLRLGRHAEARALLLECRAADEATNDVARLGMVFGALADLEGTLGQCYEAVRFQQTSLRYTYIGSEPEGCLVGHCNLANYLMGIRTAPHAVLAHRLAGTLIGIVTRSGYTPQNLAALAHDLRRAGAPVALPANFAALCATVQEVEGVRFRELMERLTRGGTPDLDALLREVIAKVTEAGAGTTSEASSDPPDEAPQPSAGPPET
jgi:hypothetical protein